MMYVFCDLHSSIGCSVDYTKQKWDNQPDLALGRCISGHQYVVGQKARPFLSCAYGEQQEEGMPCYYGKMFSIFQGLRAQLPIIELRISNFRLSEV
jgi:hypothetical protein